jgi:hypothetical protein
MPKKIAQSSTEGTFQAYYAKRKQNALTPSPGSERPRLLASKTTQSLGDLMKRAGIQKE